MHRVVLPGVCQLVQFGSTNWDVPEGATQVKLSISTVTTCVDGNVNPPAGAGQATTWLLEFKHTVGSVLVVSPQVSGVRAPFRLSSSSYFVDPHVRLEFTVPLVLVQGWVGGMMLSEHAPVNALCWVLMLPVPK